MSDQGNAAEAIKEIEGLRSKYEATRDAVLAEANDHADCEGCKTDLAHYESAIKTLDNVLLVLHRKDPVNKRWWRRG